MQRYEKRETWQKLFLAEAIAEASKPTNKTTIIGSHQPFAVRHQEI